MADVAITFRVQGTPEVLAAFKDIQAQAQQTSAAATEASTKSRTAAEQSTSALRGFRQQAVAVSMALSGVAAVASIFARNNEELRRKLEVVSLTLSGLSTTVHALSAAFRLLALNPIVLVIAGIGGLIAAGVLLVRHWDQVKAAALRIWPGVADFFGRMFHSIAKAASGLNEILTAVFSFGIFGNLAAGWDQLKTGLREIGGLMVGVGKSAITVLGAGWDRLQKFFGTTATAARGTAVAIKELRDEIDPGLVAALRHLGTMWEGASSEAERMMGWMGRSTAATKAAAQAVVDFYRTFTTVPTGDLPENRPNELLQRREALEVARALNEQVRERFEVGQATTEELERSNAELLKALKAYALVATGAEKVRIETEIWRRELEQVGVALEPAKKALTELQQVAATVAEQIRDAFQGFFANIISGTQSLGQALGNLWTNIVNIISQQLARLAANWVFQQLLTGFDQLFPSLGLPAILARQRGGEMIVTRPTLMAVGETAAERVSVKPLAGPQSQTQPQQVPGMAPTVVFNMPVYAMDSQSFLAFAARHGRGLGDIIAGEMRKNAALGKLFGGAAAP